MKVTMSEIINAILYFATIEGARIHKKRMDAIMEVNEKDKPLYTSWNWTSAIGDIMDISVWYMERMH